PSGKIRLNSFARVNDPRENKKWDIAAIVPLGTAKQLEDYDLISDTISDALKARLKLFCCCADKSEAVGKWFPEGRMGRGFAKPSMWHHYAGRHHGVCL